MVPLRTPVALLAFNRPATTRAVALAIAAARPPRVYVVLDGPRPGNHDDATGCAEVEQLIDDLDWPCEVVVDRAPANLGLRARVSSGIGWVFEQTEAAIILEDDCLPSASFFPFCDELLERYRDDTRVTSVAGCNILQGRNVTPHSYFASRYGTIWGWASWARAWQHYDVDMVDWPERKAARWLDGVLDDRVTRRFFERAFDQIHSGESQTWDVQTLYSSWKQQGLALVSHRNLVRNIGDDGSGTNVRRGSILTQLPAFDLDQPLRHPPTLERNREADRIVERLICRDVKAVKAMHHLRELPRATLHRRLYRPRTGP